MDGTPLKKLARGLDLSVDRLTVELNAIGVEVESEDDRTTGQQQHKVAQRLRKMSDQPEAPGIWLVATVRARMQFPPLQRRASVS